MKHVKLFEAFVNENEKFSDQKLEDLKKRYDDHVDDHGGASIDEIEVKGDTVIVTLEIDRFYDSGAANMTYTTDYDDPDIDEEDRDSDEDGNWERYIPARYGKIVMTIKNGKVVDWDDSDVSWADDEDNDELASIADMTTEFVKKSMQEFLSKEGIIAPNGMMKWDEASVKDAIAGGW
jgi:hypothetical protein